MVNTPNSSGIPPPSRRNIPIPSNSTSSRPCAFVPPSPTYALSPFLQCSQATFEARAESLHRGRQEYPGWDFTEAQTCALSVFFPTMPPEISTPNTAHKSVGFGMKSWNWDVKREGGDQGQENHAHVLEHSHTRL